MDGAQIFAILWVILNLFLLIGIPLGIIYGFYRLFKTNKEIVTRLDRIERRLKKEEGLLSAEE